MLAQQVYEHDLAIGTQASTLSLLSLESCGGPLWIITVGGLTQMKPFNAEYPH